MKEKEQDPREAQNKNRSVKEEKGGKGGFPAFFILLVEPEDL